MRIGGSTYGAVVHLGIAATSSNSAFLFLALLLIQRHLWQRNRWRDRAVERRGVEVFFYQTWRRIANNFRVTVAYKVDFSRWFCVKLFA
uniref:Uncharacterized protein n=1 Tax=Ciona intestinalis TaxID=7719 RepID=H2Y1K3_CIOIN